MGQEEPKDKQGGQHSQLIPWAIAIFFHVTSKCLFYCKLCGISIHNAFRVLDLIFSATYLTFYSFMMLPCVREGKTESRPFSIHLKVGDCMTYHNFLRCKRGIRSLWSREHHPRLTCVREKSELKGGTWNCCPEGWRAFQSNCYFAFHDSKTWAQSERNCTELGGHLATISTEAEQNFTTQFLEKQFSYFLGLSSENHEGQWHWVDKTPFNPQMVFWHEGEPNTHQRENCVILVNEQDKWGWKDFSCKLETSRICKIPGIAFS